jgi:DNA-binding NtrC family response regulator
MGLCLVGQYEGNPVRILIPEGAVTLGAGSECDLMLSYPTISRQHARLESAGGALTVEDLGSSNGTHIDGHRVRAATPLHIGQELRLGEIRLHLEAVAAGDDELGAAVQLPASAEEPPAPHIHATLSPLATDRLAFDHLPALLAKLPRAESLAEAGRLVGETLWAALPLAGVRMSEACGKEAIVFEAGEVDKAATHTDDTAPIHIELTLSTQCIPGREDRIFELARSLLGLVRESEPTPTPVVETRRGWPDPPPLDPDVQAIYERARRIADSDISVLIQGESGTGKDLLARFIHQQSGGPERPFIALNCAALPADLLEAELFGIEKGVATGVEARTGCFERAHGGTLFLDEIGDMSADTQAKILRVLQEGVVQRVGASKTIPARPRVVSATNRDIEAMVASGDFRLDLLHRIAGWEVTLPPLRRRPADIANLALHFLVEACRNRKTRIRGISQRALDCLRRYGWPGNVRELQREMQRVAVFLGQDDLLTGKDLRSVIRDANRPQDGDSLEGQLAAAERTIIKHALARSAGNVSEAARLLNVSRSTLYRRLEQLDLQGEERDRKTG